MMAWLCRMPPLAVEHRAEFCRAQPRRCAGHGCHPRDLQGPCVTALTSLILLDCTSTWLSAAERHDDDSHSLLSVADAVVARFGAGLGTVICRTRADAPAHSALIFASRMMRPYSSNCL